VFEWGGSYTLSAGLSGVEEADCLLLVGVSPTQDLPLLNARLRSSFLRDNSEMASMGSTITSGFPVPSVGLGLVEFKEFIQGQHPFSVVWAQAENPKLVLSSSLFEEFGDDLNTLLDLFGSVSGFSGSVNVLNLNASSVGALELGRSGSQGMAEYNALVLVGLDASEDLNSESLLLLQK
jgi:NADH dehydrogenase (ubiquinone) Fe-S protein 1